jgi:hypothetical protein
VALGKFDAMHIGHRELARRAAELGGQPYLLSFSGIAQVLGWPPRLPLVGTCDRPRVLQAWAPLCAGRAPRQLNIPFAGIRSLPAEEFVRVLAQELRVAGVVVGRNYRFGEPQPQPPQPQPPQPQPPQPPPQPPQPQPPQPPPQPPLLLLLEARAGDALAAAAPQASAAVGLAGSRVRPVVPGRTLVARSHPHSRAPAAAGYKAAGDAALLERVGRQFGLQVAVVDLLTSCQASGGAREVSSSQVWAAGGGGCCCRRCCY